MKTLKNNQMRSRQELMSRAEMILMGCTLTLDTEEEFRFVTNYILKVLNVKDVTADDVICKVENFMKSGNTTAVALVTNTLEDMKLLTFVLKDKGETLNITNPDGVLCYTYNVTVPYFSEGGYCYFQNKKGFIRRIY